jgi:hypothetical protein
MTSEATPILRPTQRLGDVPDAGSVVIGISGSLAMFAASVAWLIAVTVWK